MGRSDEFFCRCGMKFEKTASTGEVHTNVVEEERMSIECMWCKGVNRED